MLYNKISFLPNSGERSHNVVHVVGLTVDTIAYDLALADQQLGHGWWGSVAAISKREQNSENFKQKKDRYLRKFILIPHNK